MKKIRCILGLHEGKVEAQAYFNPCAAAIYRKCEYCGESFDVHYAVLKNENEVLAHFKRILLENCKLAVSENLQIHCGNFELFSKNGLPQNTQIKLDGQELDRVTSVNFYMDCEKVELKIGIEPYMPISAIESEERENAD